MLTAVLGAVQLQAYDASHIFIVPHMLSYTNTTLLNSVCALVTLLKDLVCVTADVGYLHFP